MSSKFTAVRNILNKYFSPLIVKFLEQSGTESVIVGAGGYRAASPALRRLGVDVDAWPVAPAGLFVVEERTVYLRSVDAMTVIHEFGHALDLALGGDTYNSGRDARIRGAYAAARAFVTPYAASGIDEWFAEGVRACVEANVPASPWPMVARERFQRIDPVGFEVISGLIAEAESRAVFAPGEQTFFQFAS